VSTARQRADSVSASLALRVTPWVQVLSWHETATINSSLALGDDGFGPKRLAKRSIASIWGMTAATLWLTALARDVGGSKIPAERQGNKWRALARARARLLGKFPLRKFPPLMYCVFVDEEGYPYLVRFGLLLCLLFLLQSRSPPSLARDAWRH
jgi:hypothetical protein